MNQNKVFCIGFQKTGTSSLGLALDKLGYEVASYDQFRQFAKRDELSLGEITEHAIKIASGYDAAQDSPWPVLYRELDAAFPGSKFIHIIRDRESWIRSAVKDFSDFPNSIHSLIYGCPYPLGNELRWLEIYDQHNSEVKEYFSGRQDDFVSLDLDQGEVNWEKVCAFLGKKEPDIPWPHSNKRRVKAVKMLYYKARSKLGL